MGILKKKCASKVLPRLHQSGCINSFVVLEDSEELIDELIEESEEWFEESEVKIIN